MPSLDTIRTVRVKAEAENVDQTVAALNRLTAALNAANDNMRRTDDAARQADEGWSLTSEGAAKAANHLRQAAEAAYAFSPAFRGVVNELALPALQGAGTALVAVAGGIVTATNAVGSGVVRLGTAVETSYPAFTGLGVALKAAGGWMEAFNPTLTGVAGTIIGKLMPALRILGPALLVLDGIKLVAQAWELGNKRLQEFVDIASKAAESGVSNEFYQRIAKGAEAARAPVDALTASFKKLNEATGPQLGGTAAQNRLTELTKAGNFGGNSGVAALGGADTTEQKYRAVVRLIDEAMQKGQRLAALDLAKNFLGEEVAANLAKDSDYLNRILASADAIAAQDLVPDRAIENAVMLQSRLDAAEKILSQRWHPIQDILVQLGIKMKEVWVGIVEAIAQAVDAVFRLGQRIADALGPATDYLRAAANLAGKVAQFAGNGLGPVGAMIGLGGKAASGLTAPSATEDEMTAARRSLGAQLANQARLQAAIQQATATEGRVRGDSSRNPVTETASAYDRARESVLKYIETTNAQAKAIEGTVAQQAKARIEAQLTAAAMKDGLSREAAEAKVRMSGLGDAAAKAAEALEKAKVAADIKFNRATAWLTPQDVQIASALKGIYSDLPTALASAEAAQMRFNNGLREISQLGQEVNRSLFTEFSQGIRNGETAFQAFEKAGLNALGKIADKLVQMAADQLWSSAFGGGGGIGSLFGFGGGGGIGSFTSIAAPGGGFMPFASANGNVFAANSNGISQYSGQIVDRPTVFAFANGVGLMGEAGAEAVMPLSRGTDGKLGVRASNGGSTWPAITYAPAIDARGADAAAVAKLASVMAKDRKDFERNVLAVFARARINNPGSFK
ncbi:phage tail tape measure protein (plasmid) [Bradyrhizobium oligotrophicum S58]